MRCSIKHSNFEFLKSSIFSFVFLQNFLFFDFSKVQFFSFAFSQNFLFFDFLKVSFLVSLFHKTFQFLISQKFSFQFRFFTNFLFFDFSKVQFSVSLFHNTFNFLFLQNSVFQFRFSTKLLKNRSEVANLMFHNSKSYQQILSTCYLSKFPVGNFENSCRLTSCGLASVGDLVSQMYRIKNQLPSTKPTLKFA